MGPPMKDGEEESFLVRDHTQVPGESCLDGPNFVAAKKLLLKDEDAPDDPFVLRGRLKERLERILHANGFRGSSDPFGPLVWRTLTSSEQTTIWDQDPSKVPAPRIFLFLRACLLNHSENPNAAWYVVSNAIVVHAICAIAQGEEVTISYWPDIDAADAQEVGLFEAYGIDSSTVGTAPELELTPDKRAHLQALKRVPFEVAQRLMNRSVSPNKVDPSLLFDEVVTFLSTELAKGEKELPRQLCGFLEPRILQAQLTLQQSALRASMGQSKRSEELRKLGIVIAKDALSNFSRPWSKRILLRLIYGLKAALRPAPFALMQESSSQDFEVKLSAGAQITVKELKLELEKAFGAVFGVFGDSAILEAFLSQCHVAF